MLEDERVLNGSGALQLAQGIQDTSALGSPEFLPWCLSSQLTHGGLGLLPLAALAHTYPPNTSQSWVLCTSLSEEEEGAALHPIAEADLRPFSIISSA